MSEIYSFLIEKFGRYEGPRTFFELGAHVGGDTVRLAQFPGVTLHAFEPDPQNTPPTLPNVVFTRAAVAARDGVALFTRSATRDGRPWSFSGSLRQPTGHLTAWPTVTFGDQIEVPTVRLDTYCREHRIERIDFIWADVQGCEVDVLEGGPEALARTRYLYTEYADTELYAGQITLAGILARLPGWRVVETFPTTEAYADALLVNEALR